MDLSTLCWNSVGAIAKLYVKVQVNLSLDFIN
jgi:hypothetical protein